MSDQGLERLEWLFQAAADLPADERSAFLDRECGEEAELRARVEAMLGRLEQGDSLEAPPIHGVRTGDEVPITEGPGARIGRYKLLQGIGEGGFGVVYMAEQERPVVRRVALKIIKLGMDTKEVVARFEAERQALAMMDHPNIAKVLDGGATETGRPYFVMELVRGVSITEYCDRNSLSTRERLELFLPVCHAVQHAHQKGVLHRDIKPSNVMVTLHDGTPVPKVIDFGVAKAMHGRLTDKTLFTAYERFIGTPAYMSPEQAELSGLDVDTRTDVYALGVLLYELLTGSTPFDSRSLLEGGLAEIQRVIREEQPQRPSIRISTTGDAEIAAHRRDDPNGLSKRVRGDLDWIVMRCLEKERGRRYATASELAADVQRHLEALPVLAGPPSAIYRTRKFLVRNRAAAASVSVVALVLLGGIVGTSVGMVEAGRQRDEAMSSQRMAVVEAERAQAVTDFLVGTLALADPQFALNPDVSVRELLDVAADQVGEALAAQPRSEARVRGTIGRAYANLGEHELAERHLRRAAEMAAELGDYDRADHYAILWSLTMTLFTLERYDALGVAQRARVVAHDHIRASRPQVAEALDAFITAVNSSAFTPRATDDVATAEVQQELDLLFRESVEVAEARITPGDPLWPIVADSWVAAGFALWYSPNEAQSEPYWRKALEVQRRELPADHPTIAQTASQLTGVLNRLGRPEEASAILEEIVEQQRRVLPEDSFHLAYAESMLGDNLVGLGRYAEAEVLLRRAHEVIRDHVPDETRFYYFDSLGRLIRLYEGWGREEDAAPLRDELAGIGAAASMVHGWLFARMAFGPEYAELCRATDELDTACGAYSWMVTAESSPKPELGPLLDEFLRQRRLALTDDEARSASLARIMLGWSARLALGEAPAERRRIVEEVLLILEPRVDELPLDVADAHSQLSEYAFELGEPDVAAREARLAWGILRDRDLAGNWIAAQIHLRIARTFVRQGLYGEAESVLVPSYHTLVEQIGEQNSDTEAARALIVEMYTAMGTPEKAAEVR